MKLRSDIASAAREMTSSHRVAQELRELAARLREGEVVHRLTSGKYGTGHGLLAVTDQRVVLLREGRSGQASSGFALKRLSVADWAPGAAAGTITIGDTDCSVEFGEVALAEGEELVELLRSHMVTEVGVPPDLPSSSGNQPPPDRCDHQRGGADPTSPDEATKATIGWPLQRAIPSVHDMEPEQHGTSHALPEPDAATDVPIGVSVAHDASIPALPSHGGLSIGVPAHAEGPQPSLGQTDKDPDQPDATAAGDLGRGNPPGNPTARVGMVAASEAPSRASTPLWGSTVPRPRTRSSTPPGLPASQQEPPAHRRRRPSRRRGRGPISRGDLLTLVTAATFLLAGLGGYALVSNSSHSKRVGPPTATAPPARSRSGEQNTGLVVTVSRVIDADSIEVSGPATGLVQILGILAPTGGECHAAESTAYAEGRLQGATVTLISDPSQPARDRSGRFLADVELDNGANYAVLAARTGAVTYSSTDPPSALDDQIQAAEADARRSGEGLWGPPCNGSSTGTDNVAAESATTDNATTDSATTGSSGGRVDDLDRTDASGGFSSSGTRTESLPFEPDSGSSASEFDNRGKSRLHPRLYPEHPPRTERIVPPRLGGP